MRAGDFIYVSGQGPIDPVTDKLAAGRRRVSDAPDAVEHPADSRGCGAALTDVVKCSVFLRDIADFKQMNRVYAEFFGDHQPARTTVEAKFHQAEMLVEIDCVAYKPLA